MKTINIEIESFGLVTNIFGYVIYEDEKIFNLKDVEITRSNGKREYCKKYSVPKCYISYFKINE